MWGSLALAPVTIVLHYATDIGDTAEFILASAALIPLAWLIGEATEHAAHHTGPGIGGFLNATFGNAPELIIALLAVNEGLTEVVRGSLTGSVVGNLLLVLGFSLLFGGRGALDRESSMLSIGLVTLAVILLLIPSVPGWEGDPERDSLVYISIPISIALLIVYVGATWISLRRHRQMHVSDEASDMAGWSFRTALGVLGIATVVTALIAEIVVGSIETFADKVGLTEFFVAAVIVAIVGNAAEHGGAVVVAARGQIKLAAEIALASSAQVAVFLIPAVTLLALLIDPLALSFRPIEIAALAFGVVLTFALLVQGQSSRARGVVLIAGYVAVAVAFFFAGRSLADGRRLARDRIGREVELDGDTVIVPGDPEELAALVAPGDPVEILALLLVHRAAEIQPGPREDGLEACPRGTRRRSGGPRRTTGPARPRARAAAPRPAATRP